MGPQPTAIEGVMGGFFIIAAIFAIFYILVMAIIESNEKRRAHDEAHRWVDQQRGGRG